MVISYRNIGRSLLAVVAVASLAISIVPAAKAQGVRWAYDLPFGPEVIAQTGGQLYTDQAGGIAGLYDSWFPEARKIIWLDQQGKVLAHVEVGVYSRVAVAFKDVVYLTCDGWEANSVRVVYRNGTHKMLAGASGEIDQYQLGGPSALPPSVVAAVSQPFSRFGVYAFENYRNATDAEDTAPRLRILYLSTNR